MMAKKGHDYRIGGSEVISSKMSSVVDTPLSSTSRTGRGNDRLLSSSRVNCSRSKEKKLAGSTSAEGSSSASWYGSR